MALTMNEVEIDIMEIIVCCISTTYINRAIMRRYFGPKTQHLVPNPPRSSALAAPILTVSQHRNHRRSGFCPGGGAGLSNAPFPRVVSIRCPSIGLIADAVPWYTGLVRGSAGIGCGVSATGAGGSHKSPSRGPKSPCSDSQRRTASRTIDDLDRPWIAMAARKAAKSTLLSRAPIILRSLGSFGLPAMFHVKRHIPPPLTSSFRHRHGPSSHLPSS